ncbi:hypothetical protein DBV08_17855 [Rhodococcus sp. KBW08]|uniref:hypothetical protein n=1 Tax=Rhodococcus sp. KBW08 TaxID=2144188 RepID=UPI000F5B7106|nr:hypothetical protein [Rhodococcus sp. KBW08]RQO46103.1 hypothetical protein DBV08_17855 [Rhodococcus sp. KBW08]
MNNTARDDNRSDRYNAHPGHQPARTRFTRAVPSPEVVAAAVYLLAQPDAYLCRRRYLDLITQTPGPDGTLVTDYTAAERYLLNTAASHQQHRHPQDGRH